MSTQWRKFIHNMTSAYLFNLSPTHPLVHELLTIQFSFFCSSNIILFLSAILSLWNAFFRSLYGRLLVIQLSLHLRERAGGGGQRERERKSQAGSLPSTEPDLELDLMTLRSWLELKLRIGHLTEPPRHPIQYQFKCHFLRRFFTDCPFLRDFPLGHSLSHHPFLF